jgi:PKD repeat protein
LARTGLRRTLVECWFEVSQEKKQLSVNSYDRPCVFDGRASGLQWDFGDGTIETNSSFVTTHVWTNPGDYILKATVFNSDHPAGIAATASVHVMTISAPTVSGPTISNGSLSLEFASQPGLTYQLQSTTNLSFPITWQPLQTLYSTGGVLSVSAPSVTDPSSFYRLQIQ